MVDVSAKPVTAREASASVVVEMKATVLDALMAGSLPKGDALATARVAGILAAKRTGEWIPLCHPLALDWVGVEFARLDPNRLRVECRVKTAGRTGVEMEALTGAAATALTLYDMAKAADKSIVIASLQLERKTGGKSGTYQREDNP
jgi:cyclic pyranopterin phosphate synthase